MSGYWQTTTTEQDMGYEPISIIRPSFVAFKFTGLRPNTPHWVFFDGVQVNNYVNTSYGIDDMREGANLETFTNPGDQFIDATGFPTSLGGPSTGPFNTDASGELEGLLYIQSNTTLSFTVGTKIITVIDLSVNNRANALSFAEAEVSFDGTYELYSENITKTWLENQKYGYADYDNDRYWDRLEENYAGLADGGQPDFGGGNNGGTDAGSSDAAGPSTGSTGPSSSGGGEPGSTGGSPSNGGSGAPGPAASEGWGDLGGIMV